MPSFYESLSMVTLEAWALGKPVLANARCEVLKGQCLRSNGGLFYENYDEFREALSLLLGSRAAPGRALGENGRTYFEANYTWDVIETKYLAAPRPGWEGVRPMDVHQFATSLTYGDAISDEMLEIRKRPPRAGLRVRDLRPVLRPALGRPRQGLPGIQEARAPRRTSSSSISRSARRSPSSSSASPTGRS